MEQIEFSSRGKRVFGYAHVPEREGKVPAIILCHGFGAGAGEWNRLFVDFANEAAKEGYYVIRFHCIGSGDSEYDFAENTNISGWMEDVRSALNYAVKQEKIDPKRIACMGLSMGAATMLLTASDERVASIVAWAPVVFPDQVFSGLLGDDVWSKLKKGNTRLKCISEGCPIELDSKFAEDFSKVDIWEAVKNIKKPILVLEGLLDEVIEPETTYLLKEENPAYVQHYYIEGEIHGFQNKKPETFERTLDFLDQTL